ncbi:site-specific DNA-methyltransferase [Mucilaginibacter sp. RB4R14]|uniref:DNA-methyltransferase n=1 Tax=Mucilaginibacter aurantiaciroseus TaxID=2949308 RepID=UPI0020916C0E|nr:site-specific DNA-methyltransferase [Mucilaginibacter aurantiaciroseus]MCO5933908.1 site-specific DNA-methyltransferase [Mucilaginibacter aurantiaciroseus]
MFSRFTNHKILFGPANDKLQELNDNSVNLIVTSPPYPMIEMWDEIMADQNEAIIKAKGNGVLSFELMHIELDRIWKQVERVLSPGGFACINIGDATRTINEHFSLYNNHSRIVSAFIKLGFTNMPNIIWRKQTNAPNKFMGSGMLPAGAYVTLEHEWILIFRKGGKRIFKKDIDKELRRESAFFWEERNVWFSDLWDLKGTRQKIESPLSRSRSAAYPFELPYRLINMYSVKEDVVLDPFLGTGTTTLAAIASERNSVGVEIDATFLPIIEDHIINAAPLQLNRYIQNRIEQHKSFLVERKSDASKNEIKHFNSNLNFPVMTSQETGIKMSYVKDVTKIEDEYKVNYTEVTKSEDLVLKKHKMPAQIIINF